MEARTSSNDINETYHNELLDCELIAGYNKFTNETSFPHLYMHASISSEEMLRICTSGRET